MCDYTEVPIGECDEGVYHRLYCVQGCGGTEGLRGCNLLPVYHRANIEKQTTIHTHIVTYRKLVIN